MRKIVLIFFVVVLSVDAGETETRWRFETGMALSHFQQQVKQKVGDKRGERLVNEFQIGGLISASYKIHDNIHLGIFTRVDRGERFLAQFSGFDQSGNTLTKNGIGGTYNELWIGPVVQMFWKQLSMDIGFAPYGKRQDNARSDIPNIRGNTGDAFSLHPTIAWLIAIGGTFEIIENVQGLIKIEYRPRYYSKRGGAELINSIEHGTQSIIPLIGVAYSP